MPVHENHDSPIASLLPLMRPNGQLAKAIRSYKGDDITIRRVLGDTALRKEMFGEDADKMQAQVLEILDKNHPSRDLPGFDIAEMIVDHARPRGRSREWTGPLDPGMGWLDRSRMMKERIVPLVEAATAKGRPHDLEIAKAVFQMPGSARLGTILESYGEDELIASLRRTIDTMRSDESNAGFFGGIVEMVQDRVWTSMTRGRHITTEAGMNSWKSSIAMSYPFTIAAYVVHGSPLQWAKQYATPSIDGTGFIAPHLDPSPIEEARSAVQKHFSGAGAVLPIQVDRIAEELGIPEDMFEQAALLIPGIDFVKTKHQSYFAASTPKNDGRTTVGGFTTYNSLIDEWQLSHHAVQLHSMLASDFGGRRPSIEEIAELLNKDPDDIEPNIEPRRFGYSTDYVEKLIEFAPHLFSEYMEELKAPSI